MTSFFRPATALALAFSCYATASHALACEAPPYGIPLASVKVHTGDLDLASGHDSRILDRRIRRAARRVCTAHGSDQLWSRYGDCYQRAIEDAGDQVRFLPPHRFSAAERQDGQAGAP
jgi:UrcA family protein